MDNPSTAKARRAIEIEKRKFLAEQERSLKPPECYKNLCVVIQSSILMEPAGSQIVDKLKMMEMKTEIMNTATLHTITWKRRISNRILTDAGRVISLEDIQKDEPYLMILLSGEKFVKAIKENELLNIIQSAQELHETEVRSTTLVIYGLKAFCRKRRNVISMRESEISLTQIQMIANCSHRLHETSDEVASTVVQYSKAIAEETFKSKQNQKLDQEQLYLTSDSKVSAKEDDPDSLGRLWQTQLICLPKVTFDVAQSITKEYPLPRQLIDAFETSSNPSGMLADLPIIRTGPLSKSRRIGPEMSRKIHTLMTSNNSDDIL